MNGSRSHEVDVGPSLRTGVKTRAVLSPIFLLRPCPLPGAHFFFICAERKKGRRERIKSRPQRTVFGGATPLTKQVKTAVGPIGRHQAGLLRWVRIVKYTYTNPLSNCMATCGLRGPLSAVLGPCVDSCYCCCIPVWRTCHSRWNARMGPKMGGQLDDPPDSRGGESRPQRTTFGGATPLTKPVKNTLKTAVSTKGSHRADLH